MPTYSGICPNCNEMNEIVIKFRVKSGLYNKECNNCGRSFNLKYFSLERKIWTRLGTGFEGKIAEIYWHYENIDNYEKKHQFWKKLPKDIQIKFDEAEPHHHITKMKRLNLNEILS